MTLHPLTFLQKVVPSVFHPSSLQNLPLYIFSLLLLSSSSCLAPLPGSSPLYASHLPWLREVSFMPHVSVQPHLKPVKELLVPPGLRLTRVRGVFQKFIQPRYVDFVSLEDMFDGLQPLFDTQGWTVFLYSHKRYSPIAVTKFFDNLGMSVDEELYTMVK
ncbi:hypothetical protein Taro_008939, partial [Colocasia esculenta]|nr:hypothetical protein [Colocasia esculenta]